MSENKSIQTTQQKNITDQVSNRIKELSSAGEINFPASYSYTNALKSAYLILSETLDKNKKPALEVCSKESIVNTLFDMCLQGLSPAKKQCYFVVYGNKLQLMKSYLGNMAATKRLKGVKNIFAQCIYKDDVFEYTLDPNTGLKKITKHEQKFDNIDIENIKGAYAVVVMEDGNNYVEMMTIKQIKSAWSMGKTYPYSTKDKPSVHDKFTDEMAKKTVINRACKNFVCTSDDSDLLIESLMRTNEYKQEDIIESTHEKVQEEIKENANTEVIDVDIEEEVKPVNNKPNNPESTVTFQQEMDF